MGCAASGRGRPIHAVRAESWPGWAERVAPLQRYLDAPEGRSWRELKEWAQGEGLFRERILELENAVAWLEGRGLALSSGEGRRVRWFAAKRED